MEGPPKISPGEEKVNEYVSRIKSGESKEKILEGLPSSFKTSIEEKLSENPYGEFKVKNGETDKGVFWYEYGNKVAKEMKEKGRFEWGKERIYFDIPFVDMIKLRDIVMSVASAEKIPIAFKHLDMEKTFNSQKDGNETRFVTNFATPEDALRFYTALIIYPGYNSLHSDRNMSYGGYRADEIAEYSNGYRERRDALKRIMNGSFNSEGKWQWEVQGNVKTITKEQYETFKKEFDDFSARMEDIQKKWEKVKS